MRKSRKIIFHRLKMVQKPSKIAVFGCFWALLRRFCFTWNTHPSDHCSTWNIYFLDDFKAFGDVSRESLVLFDFCLYFADFSTWKCLIFVDFLTTWSVLATSLLIFEEFFSQIPLWNIFGQLFLKIR